MVAPGAEKAHELRHHDQRAGRRFGQPQPVQHLAGGDPAVMVDRLLGDIGQHRIGAAERDHRHLAEEDRDLGEDVVGPAQEPQQGHRDEPQSEENRQLVF